MNTLINCIIALLITTITVAQTNADLKLHDKASNFILPSYKNTVESVSFPNKNNVVYIHFWNSNEEKSKENFYKYKRIYKQNNKVAYKTCDGFDIIFVALQADKLLWETDIKKYNLEKFNNYIAVKAYDDYFIKQFKVNSVPKGYVIDEAGEIVSLNPSVDELLTVINDKRTNPIKPKKIKEITGKIAQPLQENKKYIGNEKIYVTNSKKDTIQTLTTTSAGSFTITNVENEADLTLLMSNSENINADESLLLENETGEIINDFSHVPTGYECKLSKHDMIDMVPTVTEFSEYYYSENLFASGGTTLNFDAKRKLNILIETLKQNQNLKVDVITHTDCKGDALFNEKLSLKRANVCATYFVSKGIQKNRIVTIGKGESMPKNGCVDGVNCTDKELEENRRTEFKFYRMP